MTTHNTIHGDVDLLHLDTLPDGFTKQSKPELRNGAYVVEAGEHSGHYHVLTPTKDSQIEVFENQDGDKIFQIKFAPAVITHEEHAPLIIQPGIYRKKIETEYDPFAQVIQQVVD